MKVCKLLGKEAATPLAEYTAFRSTFSAPVIKQVLAVFSTAPGVPLTAARATWLCAYGTKTTLPATGFLGFLDPQKHSAATQPVQEAVAALPVESSQRTLTHRTVTKASTEPNQQPGQSPVVDH